jgi:hypothetical protein
MIAKVMDLKRIGYTFEAIGMTLTIGTSTARDMWLDGMEQVILVPVRAGRRSILSFSDVRPARGDVGASSIVAGGRSRILFPLQRASQPPRSIGSTAG